MAAALEASSKIGSEGTVYILESMPKVGGNSAKASSGMNGCYTEIQAAHEITDSLGVFKEDTLRMAKGLANPALVSAANLDLGLTSPLSSAQYSLLFVSTTHGAPLFSLCRSKSWWMNLPARFLL